MIGDDVPGEAVIKRAIVILVVILLIVYIVKAPESAAHAVHVIWNWIVNVFNGARQFLEDL